MLQLSFKNRIAFNYIITSAILIFIVFLCIYTIVRYSVYSHVNNDIAIEVKKHLSEFEIKNQHIQLINKREWQEREHNTIDVNPVFVQFIDVTGLVVEKSPNLKNKSLKFDSEVISNELFDTKLVQSKIRQIQVPLYQNSKTVGYLIIAMSLVDASMVLNNLFNILIIAFPLIMIVLFLNARFFAGKSIKPISSIIETANFITKDNLKSRIELPHNQDELYVLSQTINNLLDRVEKTIEREKQFTSDASHELRTPLTVIKGTLEVLIRKPRDHSEYESKINFCVKEVNRLDNIVDQLLLLAKFENQKQSLIIEKVNLEIVILDAISRYSNTIQTKNIQVSTQFTGDSYVNSDNYLVSIVINNLISNALKYSNENSNLNISIAHIQGKIECCIADSGIGIPAEDLEKIFNQFYRSKSDKHVEIKGTGLGLSIVKRLCSLLTIEINISSQEQVGTRVTLIFY